MICLHQLLEGAPGGPQGGIRSFLRDLQKLSSKETSPEVSCLLSANFSCNNILAVINSKILQELPATFITTFKEIQIMGLHQ